MQRSAPLRFDSGGSAPPNLWVDPLRSFDGVQHKVSEVLFKDSHAVKSIKKYVLAQSAEFQAVVEFLSRCLNKIEIVDGGNKKNRTMGGGR